MQVSPSQLVVEVESKENRGSCHTLELNTDLQVKGVAVTTDHVALWSSKTFVVYQLITEGLGDDTRITSKTVGMYHLYHIMPWNGTRNGNPRIADLVKKFPVLDGTQRLNVDYHVHSYRHLLHFRFSD